MKTLTGDNIKSIRIKMNMSQDQLARKLNMFGRATISRWECGYCKPSIETCRKIISLAKQNLIDVDLDYLRPD